MHQPRIATALILSIAVAAAATAALHAETRRAFIVCGLPGDEEHRTQFNESVTQIHHALTNRFGFGAANINIQLGHPETEAAPAGMAINGRATREEIAAAARQLVQATTQQDTLWVFVIGHAYFDGKQAYLNIPDSDITQADFARLFDKVAARQTVFFMCTSVSGLSIKHLSKPGRIVITSTEADRETNASIFHTALAKTLLEIEPNPQFDFDKDGRVTLLDLYIKANQLLVADYLAHDPPLIPTEHPQLDDDGDGRGSELQIDYLTVAQGGRSDASRKRGFRKFNDGVSASQISLPFDSLR